MSKDQGLSLLDIGPLSKNVPVGTEGKSLAVYGVSVEGIFAIFQRYPEVGQWFKGGIATGGKSVKFDPQVLLVEAPDAIAAVIACGCGSPGNAEAEKIAGKLAVEAQLDVLEAIIDLTFTKGFGPFVQRIVALSAQVQSLNYGKGLDTTSRASSNPASQTGTTAEKSGG